jgi:hypothetical protein
VSDELPLGINYDTTVSYFRADIRKMSEVRNLDSSGRSRGVRRACGGAPSLSAVSLAFLRSRRRKRCMAASREQSDGPAAGTLRGEKGAKDGQE